MRNQFAAIPISGLLALASFVVSPADNIPGPIEKSPIIKTLHDVHTVNKEASVLYHELQLTEKGLSEQAFAYAYKGYKILLEKKLVSNTDYLTICDFSQSSRQKRLYLIDLSRNEVLMNTWVAHGRNSGLDFASKFSNKPESLQSSLGFYITKQTYYGAHGLSLRLDGLEPGFNDKAFNRAIVIHGADYIGESRLRQAFMGRSYGCPAVPQQDSKALINTIKNGTCVFIYFPETKYLNGSKILND